MASGTVVFTLALLCIDEVVSDTEATEACVRLLHVM